MLQKIDADMGYEIVCDGRDCDASDSYDTTDFLEAVKLCKDAGWKIRKVDGNWCHFCPECVEQGKHRSTNE